MERMNEFLYLKKAKRLVRQDRIIEIWIQEPEPGVFPIYIYVKLDYLDGQIAMRFENFDDLKDELDLILANTGIKNIEIPAVFHPNSIDKDDFINEQKQKK